MKDGSIVDPDIYLEAKIHKTHLPNGVNTWYNSPSKYVQEVVRNIEEHLVKEYDRRRLVKCASAPFLNNYKLELDMSTELEPKQASYYQTQIDGLHWMVEIRRVDIIAEVFMTPLPLAMTR